jgi:hypothetical protein
LIFAELGAPSIPSSLPISKVHEVFEKKVKRFLDEFEWYIDH